MKLQLCLLAVMTAGTALCSAQVASHAPALKFARPESGPQLTEAQLRQKVAARVNGTVLTELDVRREMLAIFPYAQQHGGNVPKAMEPEIRKGALDMVIFEELLYQDAKRRNVQVPAERMAKAENDLRRQFPNAATYNDYLHVNYGGNQKAMREMIRRSLLIELMLKTEVKQKSVITVQEAKNFYLKNPKKFEHGETAAIQTISMIPPEGATKAMENEAYAKIKDALRLARAAKTSRDFGILAEQISEDDWHTQMGDRKTVELSSLPPDVVTAIRKTKVGQVTDIVKLGKAYVIVRVNAHTAPGRTPFEEVKAKLIDDMQKEKTQTVRSQLNQRLRKSAKIEVL